MNFNPTLLEAERLTLFVIHGRARASDLHLCHRFVRRAGERLGCEPRQLVVYTDSGRLEVTPEQVAPVLQPVDHVPERVLRVLVVNEPVRESLRVLAEDLGPALHAYYVIVDTLEDACRILDVDHARIRSIVERPPRHTDPARAVLDRLRPT